MTLYAMADRTPQTDKNRLYIARRPVRHYPIASQPGDFYVHPAHATAAIVLMAAMIPPAAVQHTVAASHRPASVISRVHRQRAQHRPDAAAKHCQLRLSVVISIQNRGRQQSNRCGHGSIIPTVWPGVAAAVSADENIGLAVEPLVTWFKRLITHPWLLPGVWSGLSVRMRIRSFRWHLMRQNDINCCAVSSW